MLRQGANHPLLLHGHFIPVNNTEVYRLAGVTSTACMRLARTHVDYDALMGNIHCGIMIDVKELHAKPSMPCFDPRLDARHDSEPR
jgi:hypothetical protein